MKRKILGVVMALCMIISCVPFTAHAATIVASGNCGTYNYDTQQYADNSKWTLDSNGTFTVSGTDFIGANWVYNNAKYTTDIKKLVIKDGIEGIGYGAFLGCNNLAEISIPDSVIEIESAALNGTAWYDNQPYGSVYAGKILYNYKYENSIEENTTLKIREGTVSISGTLGDFVMILPSEISKITNIEFPDSLKTISPNALNFTGWYKKQPDGVVYINDILYKYKGNMAEEQDIHIKDGTKTICKYAFHSGNGYPTCDKMKAVYIPTSLQTVYPDAFLECSSLTDIYYAGTEEQWNNSTITVFNDDNGNDSFMNATVHILGIAPTPSPTAKPTPNPTPAPKHFTISGSRVTNTDDTAQTATIITAQYSGKKLTDVTSREITFAANETKTFTVPTGGKLFVWDSVSGMYPLTK